MPRKIQDCTRDLLTSIPLPVYSGDTYTVISHESIMDYTTTALNTAGFFIESEEYRATADGQIAQGIYKLTFNQDPELSMMFAWTNSYNKQIKFKCAIGGYINANGGAMLSGEMGSWSRKHTGNADEEAVATITDQISNAILYYTQLISDKQTMKTVSLTKRKQAQLLGILFAEYQILTTEQASIIRQLMEKPKQVFEDSNSLWAFYNHVTTALQYSHPRTWMEDQRILHFFISTVTNFQQVPTPAPAVAVPVDPLNAIPNQTNILDQIAEIESTLMADDDVWPEVEEVTDGIYVPVQEPDVVEYTDPAGNTFEAIDFHNAVTAEEEVVDIIEAEKNLLTEDELAHQLYGVDNDIEVSIVIDDFITDEEEVIEEEVVVVAPERVKFSVDNTEDNSEFDLDFNENTSDDEEDEGEYPDLF